MPYDARPDLRDLCLVHGLSPSILGHLPKTNPRAAAPQPQGVATPQTQGAAAPQTQDDELDPEPHQTLGQVEGDRLIEWATFQIAQGSPVSYAMIREFANRTLDAQGAPRDTFGDAWIHRLLQGGQTAAMQRLSALTPPSGPADDETRPRQPMTKARYRAYVRDLNNPWHSQLTKRLLIKLIEQGFYEMDLESDRQARRIVALEAEVKARTEAKAREDASRTKPKKSASRTQIKKVVAKASKKDTTRARTKEELARIKNGAVLPEPGSLFVNIQQIRRAMVEAGRIPPEEE